jgi:hypothetical protein
MVADLRAAAGRYATVTALQNGNDISIVKCSNLRWRSAGREPVGLKQIQPVPF